MIRLSRRLFPGCVGLAMAALTPAATSTQGWKLTWSDEFEVDGAPDPAKWDYDEGGHGWGNQELQFYTKDRRGNARVENGHLIVEARCESWLEMEYTSARLVTRARQS